MQTKRSSCFEGELALISNAKLREFVTSFLDDLVPGYFYTVPASSTGKYHPSYALGNGGLVRHTKAAVKIAEDMLSLEQNETLSALHHDNIISALILHDTFKHGLNGGGYTKFEHPIFAANAIILFAKEYRPELLSIAEEISDLVITHMGQWTTSKQSKLVLPKPQSEAQKFVHLCDYLASRKYLTVDVKYEPQEEDQAE